MIVVGLYIDGLDSDGCRTVSLSGTPLVVKEESDRSIYAELVDAPPVVLATIFARGNGPCGWAFDHWDLTTYVEDSRQAHATTTDNPAAVQIRGADGVMTGMTCVPVFRFNGIGRIVTHGGALEVGEDVNMRQGIVLDV